MVASPNEDSVSKKKEHLKGKGAVVKIVATHGGPVKSDKNKVHKVDAVYIPGGEKSLTVLKNTPKSVKFVNETLKHCKAIAADSKTEGFLGLTYLKDFKDDQAVLIGKASADFAKQIAGHRNWERRKS